MTINDDKYIHDYVNRMAPRSHRQIPVYSHVGKGLPGDTSILNINDDNELECLLMNQATQTINPLWSLPLADLAPKLHYKVYKGVREIDQEVWWGYYIRFTCDYIVNNNKTTLWQFDTPFTVTNPFYGTSIPEDTVIDSDE